MKQPLYPRDILKIHSSDIIKNNYSLDINIDNARKNKEVISISDNQVIRWIDNINNIDRENTKLTYENNLKKIRSLKKESGNGLKIKELYSELDKIQFIPDENYVFPTKNIQIPITVKTKVTDPDNKETYDFERNTIWIIKPIMATFELEIRPAYRVIKINEDAIIAISTN